MADLESHFAITTPPKLDSYCNQGDYFIHTMQCSLNGSLHI